MPASVALWADKIEEALTQTISPSIWLSSARCWTYVPAVSRAAVADECPSAARVLMRRSVAF